MPDTARPPQYAVVAYVRNSVGQFVENLRRELYPQHGHLPAHVTLLPPRYLCGSEDEARVALALHLNGVEQFQIRIGQVESFIPKTPTVFLRVEGQAHRFRELHDDLNAGAFDCHEPWPYMPHLTIVKMPDIPQAEQALRVSRERWKGFTGSRTAQITEVTFVRESSDSHWTDLATFSLKPGK